MPNIAVFAESGGELSTLSLAPSTLQNLYNYRSFLIELYGRARTIVRLFVDRREVSHNEDTVPSLFIKVIKGEEDVVKRLNYSVLATALSNHPTNECPIRIYFQDKVDDHNIRNH